MAGIDLRGPAGTTNAASAVLTPTAVKTAAYTAVVGDLAMMNVAGGGTALTLPTAPADKAQVGYRAIGATTGVPLTVTAGGSDTIGTAGAATASIPLADEVAVLQYQASATRWLAVSNVKTQASLDARYDVAGAATTAQAGSLQKSSNLSDLANAATARTNLGLGTAATQASTAFDAAGAATTAQAAATVATLPLPQVGEWITPPFTGTGNFAFSDGELRLGEMFLPPGTYDALAWIINAAGSAGSVSRALVYSDNGSGLPNTLLMDSGTVDSTTTGTKQVTGLSLVVTTTRRVWVGAVSQGNPTTKPQFTYAAAAGRGFIGTTAVPSNSLPPSWSNTSVTGAPPTPITTVRANAFPCIAIRRSA